MLCSTGLHSGAQEFKAFRGEQLLFTDCVQHVQRQANMQWGVAHTCKGQLGPDTWQDNNLTFACAGRSYPAWQERLRLLGPLPSVRTVAVVVAVYYSYACFDPALKILSVSAV